MSTIIDWMKTLTWKCDVCHQERPDEFISVWKIDQSRKYHLPPGGAFRNVKYCNDRESCFRGAKALEGK